MALDFEVMYRAMDSRDPRFDGTFFVAVTSTGIYCRPVCPAQSPKRSNTRFYRYAAVAELAGFRPCRRCRPETSPDSPEWDRRADLIGRGLSLIAQGVADAGVTELARRLGVSDRHLQRVFRSEIGTTPGVVARSRRARLARSLLAETDAPITACAYMAGFTSVRAFNETMQRLYRITPTEIRRGRPTHHGGLELQLRYRPTFDLDRLIDYLEPRAVPGVEEVTPDRYRRSTRFGAGEAVIEVSPNESGLVLRVISEQTGHLAPVVQGVRHLFDLDADPATVESDLSRSPILRRLVESVPGLRVPGSYDPFEVAVGVVLTRGLPARSGASRLARLVTAAGTLLSRPIGSVTHLFPTPEQVVGADLGTIGLPSGTIESVRTLAGAVAHGDLSLDGSMDQLRVREALVSIPGIGPWTASHVALRTLRDPDAFPETDSALRRAYSLLDPEHEETLGAAAVAWRPWRAYAAMHLWVAGSPQSTTSW